jgi:hypothetical protein
LIRAVSPRLAASPTKRPKNVLIFTRSTNAYVHESKLPATMAIKAALAPIGVTSELSDDVGVFTTASLARGFSGTLGL